jgi:uncharacterized protein YjiS (DUF1127 family)
MSTMILNFTAMQSRRTFGWNQVKQCFAEWRRRARSRSELMNLSDRDLLDIGMSRCDASGEVCKPFWMA